MHNGNKVHTVERIHSWIVQCVLHEDAQSLSVSGRLLGRVVETCQSIFGSSHMKMSLGFRMVGLLRCHTGKRDREMTN